jgi:rubrerythrin
MNLPTSPSIETIGEFLVHALELETESAERYRQLAQSMEVHNNPEISELFQRLALLSEAHAQEVEEYATDVDLPEIPPWGFKWDCPGSPEMDCLEQNVSYLMTAVQALTLALHNEIRGRDFYAHVAIDSPNPEVRRLAGQMTEEESEHVDLLKDWLAKESHSDEAAPEDLDPPNSPE